MRHLALPVAAAFALVAAQPAAAQGSDTLKKIKETRHDHARAPGGIKSIFLLRR